MREAPNLSRTIYATADIGIPKPDALAGRLRAIDPAVHVDRHVSPLGLTDLRQTLDGITLVVAATDDMVEQALLAHYAYAAGVPLVACALYKGAAAGEVGIREQLRNEDAAAPLSVPPDTTVNITDSGDSSASVRK